MRNMHPRHASLHVYMALKLMSLLFLPNLSFLLSFISILISCSSHHAPPFFAFSLLPLLLSTDQRLDLNKLSPNDSDTVRGQIVGEST